MIVGVMMEAEDEEEIDQKAPVVAGVGIRAAVADGEMTLMTKMTMTRIGGEEGGRAAEGTAAESGIPLGGITAGADTDADAVEVIPANDIGGEGTGSSSESGDDGSERSRSNSSAGSTKKKSNFTPAGFTMPQHMSPAAAALLAAAGGTPA
eukprot:CAMPEP_0117768308 /NCGR_PEP_ID=MMETSP0947-20121206/22276_1 /TAXON_ID=44440 /ORGANISM="Chattonella subsalsa, Strain CCMP2191" /LENGTH=150 /DNA_ID=CAMNT_0005592421 /DNA_START=94 /DNA_END=541 /DNA_ORIENTATION=-